MAHADLLVQVWHLGPVGDRREGVVAVRQHQRVLAHFVDEEPEDAFLPSRRETKAKSVSPYCTQYSRGSVAAGQRQLEVGEAVGLEDRGDDVAGGEVLEHAVVAGQGQPPEPWSEYELKTVGSCVGGELVDFGDQGVEGALLGVVVQGGAEVRGDGVDSVSDVELLPWRDMLSNVFSLSPPVRFPDLGRSTTRRLMRGCWYQCRETWSVTSSFGRRECRGYQQWRCCSPRKS